MSAYETNWAAMGLYPALGRTAFEQVPPRGTDSNVCTAPKKRGPKPSKVQQSAIALETPAERRARQLQVNSAPNFNVPIATTAQSDRTLSIGGRKL